MGTGDLLVALASLAALFGVWARGPRWTFESIYVPALLLIPMQPVLDFSGLPDLNPHRGIAGAMVFAGLLNGTLRSAFPRRMIALDWLALAPILSFSISYAIAEDAAGLFNIKAFIHKVPLIFLDWGCPYLFTRGLITERKYLARLLRPVALATILLGFLAIVECRLAIRFTVMLWNSFGLNLPVPPHYGDFRLGFLRSFTHFLGPITLGTVFVTLIPLALAHWVIDPQRRHTALVAAGAAAIGVACCLSRGPALVMILLGVIMPALIYRWRVVGFLAMFGVLLAIPTLIVVAGEAVAYTQARIDATGNTGGESGYYRIALLLIYGQKVLEVGLFGDPTVIGAQFSAANSIDNGYLYLSLVGGWMGGGLFLAITALVNWRCWHNFRPQRGAARLFAAAIWAALMGVSLCMANVWFAPDYATWYWVLIGLGMNLPRLLVR